MVYNSTGLRFAFQKFESVGFFSVFLVFFSWVFSLLFSFCFVGRTSHHSLGFFSFSCIFSSINIFFFVSDQKKKKY